jgi:hypothetical protein
MSKQIDYSPSGTEMRPIVRKPECVEMIQDNER